MMDGNEACPTLKLSRYSGRKPVKRPAEKYVKLEKQAKRRRKTITIPIPSFSPIDKLEDLDTSILDTPVKKKLESIVWDDDDDDYVLPPPVFGTSQNAKVSVPNKSPVRQVSAESVHLVGPPELSLELAQTIDKLLKDVDASKVILRGIVDMVEHGNNKELRNQIRAYIKYRMGMDDLSPKDPVAKEAISRKTKEALKPEKDALLLSVDCLFVQADPGSTTMKDFMISLEAEYGAKLHKDCRVMVKAHLKDLFSGEVAPSVSLPTMNDMQDVVMDVGSLEEPSMASLHKMKVAVSIDAQSSDDIVAIAINQVDESGDESGKAETSQVVSEVQLPEPAKPKTQNKRGRPRKNANSDQISVEQPNHTSTTTGNSREHFVQKPKPPTKPRAKKGTCALCTTCICTIGNEANVEENPGGMSRTDAEIEHALIRKAKKLEDIVDKYEAMLDRVKRELKKHRRDIWKKEEANLNDGKQLAFGDSRFLPDAYVWDEQAQAVKQEALPRSVVHEAQGTVFGGNYQTTLTQMFGGGRKKDDENSGEHIDSTDDHDADHDADNDATVLDLCFPPVTDENNEDGLEVAQAVEDYTSIDPETVPVDRIHRLSWREGAKAEAQSPLLRGSGVWSALTTRPCTIITNASDCLSSSQYNSIASPPRRSSGLLRSTSNDDKYICAWDALFSDHVASDDGAVTQLLDLFEAETAGSDATCAETPTNELTPSQLTVVETPILTQRGESLAEMIEDKITLDPIQMQAVEAVCPNWRENIRYALAQRGEDEVREALERVQRSLKNLETMKEKIPALWKRQEVVLQLFEMSLSESLTRLTTNVRSHYKCADDSQVVSSEPPNAALMCLQDDGIPALSPISEGDENSDRVDNDLVEPA